MEPVERVAPARASLAQLRASVVHFAGHLAGHLAGALGDLLLAPRLSAPFTLFTAPRPRAPADEPAPRLDEPAP